MSHLKNCCCNLKHCCCQIPTLSKSSPTVTNASSPSSSSSSSSSSPTFCSAENFRRIPNVYLARERLEEYQRELQLMTPSLVHNLPSYRAD